MNCPICKQRDEFVYEESTGVWRCDRCHEKFKVKPQNTTCDCAEEFEKIPKSNADRIRAMSDEELAKFLATVKCRGAAAESCDAFWEDTSYEIDWLKQAVMP